MRSFESTFNRIYVMSHVLMKTEKKCRHSKIYSLFSAFHFNTIVENHLRTNTKKCLFYLRLCKLEEKNNFLDHMELT